MICVYLVENLWKISSSSCCWSQLGAPHVARMAASGTSLAFTTWHLPRMLIFGAF